MTAYEKSQLRAKQKHIRAYCHQHMAVDAAEKAARVGIRAISGMGSDLCVGLYSPIHTELDCRFLALSLERRGHPLALPAVVGADQPLVFRRWGPGDPLMEGAFGTLEPEIDAPIIVPDVLICPLLGFDAEGFRLGYGGGYYDRTLAQHSHIKAFGFGFAAQLIDDLPRDTFDFPMMAIITEEGLVIPQKIAQ